MDMPDLPDRDATERDAPASPIRTPQTTDKGATSERCLPDWIAPGQQVVVIAGRNNTPSPVLTIERVLKRDVVLSNADRWSLTRLDSNGECITKRSSERWSPSTKLYAADAHQVRAARLAQERRATADRCRTIADRVLAAVRQSDWDEARRLHAHLGEWLASAPEAPRG